MFFSFCNDCIVFITMKSSRRSSANESFDILFALKVSVVDELGIPVKFVGVGEGVEDLQPFDAEAFVSAIFP